LKRSSPARCFITRNNPQGRYLASILKQHIEGLVLIVEGETSNSFHKALRQSRKHWRRSIIAFLSYIFSLPVHLFLEALFNHKVKKAISAPESFPKGTERIDVKSINNPSAIEIIKQISPASTVVYGSSIIKTQTLIHLGNALNCHMGIVPQYRGAKSEFWALSQGQPHLVGFSIHTLERELDSGASVFQYKLSPQSSSPALCRAQNLLALGEQLAEVWLDHEQGDTKPIAQSGETGLYSTPPLMKKLRWILKTKTFA
jgi:hypothetical protein